MNAVLQAFEILEQYADGDDSFKSDCTIVRNVLKPNKELSPMITSRIPEANPAGRGSVCGDTHSLNAFALQLIDLSKQLFYAIDFCCVVVSANY